MTVPHENSALMNPNGVSALMTGQSSLSPMILAGYSLPLMFALMVGNSSVRAFSIVHICHPLLYLGPFACLSNMLNANDFGDSTNATCPFTSKLDRIFPGGCRNLAIPPRIMPEYFYDIAPHNPSTCISVALVSGVTSLPHLAHPFRTACLRKAYDIR
jgi:hypothetical protein